MSRYHASDRSERCGGCGAKHAATPHPGVDEIMRCRPMPGRCPGSPNEENVALEPQPARGVRRICKPTIHRPRPALPPVARRLGNARRRMTITAFALELRA